LSAIVAAVEAKDDALFSTKVGQFIKMTPFDKVKT